MLVNTRSAASIAARTETVCAACGSAGARVLHAECIDRLHPSLETWTVVACTGCGLARTDPQPAREELDRYYPQSYVSYVKTVADRSPARRAVAAALRLPYRLRWHAQDVDDPPYPGARALDVGCGIGLHLSQLRGRGWVPFGIEPSTDAAAAARRATRGAGEVVAATVEDATFPDSSFELVTMFHVLEHVHDPVGVLRSVRGWLAADGTLRIRVPNVASAESRLFGRFWFGLDVPRHLHHFTPETLRVVIAKAGLRVARVVPEFQASSFAGSVLHTLAHARARREEYRHSAGLYYAALPFAALAAPLGWSACIDVTASKDAT